MEMTAPSAVGDSLYGVVAVPARDEPVGFAASEVASVGKQGAEHVLHLRNGSSVRIAGFWMRGDSVGGHIRMPDTTAVKGIAVAEVERLEVRRIPKVAERVTGDTARKVVLPGERVRVTYARHLSSAAAPRGRKPVTCDPWEDGCAAGPAGGGKGTVRAILERVVGDTVWVWGEQEELLWIPLTDVSKLEVQVGTGRRTLRGAAIGFGIAGVLTLGTVAAIAGAGDDAGNAVMGVFAIGAALGFLSILVGTAAGAASTHDRWDEVPLAALRAAR